ncbi:MAG: DUF6338 family protein [Deltaproteobacteria bacterium]|jgi:hypothetical protein|nr:DUF6338 family protein [Deltaproteobacteria bacterium]
MALNSFNVVLYTAIFLVPGFFIQNIIISLNPTRRLSDNISFLSFFMYSIINLAVWSWAYIWLTNIYNNKIISDYHYLIYILLISLLGGLILAFAIGIIIQKRVIKSLAKIFKLHYIDPIDSAWDWLFSKDEQHVILITLKDNSEIYGWYGYNSFTSSNINERDMFVELTYKKDTNGYYYFDPNSYGIYISKDLIKHIELKS